jgi:hypothetical protein
MTKKRQDLILKRLPTPRHLLSLKGGKKPRVKKKMIWISRDTGKYTHSYNVWTKKPRNLGGDFFGENPYYVVRFDLLPLLRPDIRLPAPGECIKIEVGT